MKVCILTAGKGTRMGQFSKIVNKSLLPVNKKAIISHIIDYFPKETQFVIAMGYLGEQVKSYLSLAHPTQDFTFVNIENFDGVGSGPGFSLLACSSYLQEPFFYTPCDCMLTVKLPNVFDRNWLGIEKVDESESINYCNVAIQNGKVTDIRDKELCNANYFAFTAPLFVHDYTDFWNALKNSDLIKNEHQISNGIHALIKNGLESFETSWINIGDIEKYNQLKTNENSYDFSKPDELIYFVNNKVIKFFANSEILNKRVVKSKIKPGLFPKISISGKNFYSYDFFKGDVFYSVGNPKLFSDLLYWLEENLWGKKSSEKEISSLCKEFYFEKTLSRYKKFVKDFPEYPYPKRMNGQEIISFDIILKKIPWNILYDGKQRFIHGDLNFGNILYDEKLKKFLLIDWRQDFGGIVEYGDIYYDLAKLWAGIKINFELIRKDKFKIEFQDDDCMLEVPNWEYQTEYEEILDNFLDEKEFDKHKVHLLGGITFINMAPLHLAPFNFLLQVFGSSIIQNEIKYFSH